MKLFKRVLYQLAAGIWMLTAGKNEWGMEESARGYFTIIGVWLVFVLFIELWHRNVED
jgi:hypothetical protein